MISAAVIATLGLLVNSAAVIIGAMIVAPLMNPILSMAFAIVTGNWKLYKRSWVTVALGAFTAILIASLISAVVPIHIVHAEILARTSPNLIDLVIAIAAGAAGSFSLTRKSIANSIAGVAIAVALVPPLCVVGIGLGIGSDITAEFGRVLVSNLRISTGAFLLFLANFAGITFTACLVFLSQSYGSLRLAYRKLFVWAIIVAVLCGPLYTAMQEFLISGNISLEMNIIKKENPQFWDPSQIRYVGVKLEDNTAHVKMLVNAPAGLLPDEHLKEIQRRLFNSVSNLGIEAMDLNIRIIPVEIREYQGISK